jgi:sulfur-carrier protein adenylyltransferase/sulfurtransferase
VFNLSERPLNTSQLAADLQNDSAGALATFEGWVRNQNDGHQVTLLEYEAYPQLAQSEGEKILREALDKFGVIAARCVHRVGALSIGDSAVWIGVTSRHRKEAFMACRWIIDAIKSRVPIWKKEHYVNGTSGWVNCHDHATPGGIMRSHINEGCLDEEAIYSSQTGIPEIGKAGQAALKRSKVLVVGAGGLGCSALAHLASAGVGKVGICDFDTVEISDLNRQFLYSPQDIGMPKADLAAKQVRRINPITKVNSHVAALAADNARELLEPYDVVLDCTNDISSSRLITDLCLSLQTPLVHACVNGLQGRICTILPESDGGCLACTSHEKAGQESQPSDQVGMLGAAAGCFGVLQGLEAIKLILQLPVLSDQTLFVDLLTYRSRVEKRPSVVLSG